MKSVFHSSYPLSLAILLASTAASIYAKYCPGNLKSSSCCPPYGGMDAPTCPGVGTTDVADLIGHLVRGGETYSILGQTEGLYYIFAAKYKLLSGVEAVLMLESLLAYILETPNEEGGHTYYYISMGGCPEVFTISADTNGTIPSTRLQYSAVYNLIKISNSEPNCDGPCSTVTGESPPNYSIGPFPELDLNIPLSFSSVYAVNYHCLNNKYSRAADELIRKYELDIEPGNCTSLKIQRGYGFKDGAELCYRSDSGTPTGRYIAKNFDLKRRLAQKNGLCLLATKLNKLGATFPYPYYLYHERIRIIAYPFRCVVTVSCYLSEIVGYQMNGPFANLC